MKKFISLALVLIMVFCIVGCRSENSADSQSVSSSAAENSSNANCLSDEELAKTVAKKLNVPEKQSITYKIGEKFLYEAAETYCKNVAFYENNEMVASATVNAQNGELVRNIYKYDALESLSARLVFEIDSSYQEESKLPEYSTTSGMVELADKYAEKWKQVADEYYNKIMNYDGLEDFKNVKSASDILHARVLEMKANWEEYYQDQCSDYVETLKVIYSGGTIISPLFAHYKCEMQKDWALELVGIYEQLYIDEDKSSVSQLNSQTGGKTISIDKAESNVYDAAGKPADPTFFRCEWVEFIGEKAYYMISRNEDYPDRVVTTAWYAVEVFSGDVYKYNLADSSLQPI